MKTVEKLKTVITNNWKLKLPALALAVVIFYAIRGATSFEVPYDIVIKVDVEEGIAILDQPKTVRVTFRGSQEDLRRLSQKEITAVIKPKATDPAGSERIKVRPGDIEGQLFGVRVVQIEPQVIKIAFDREIEKEVAVTRPQVIGSPLIGKVELDYMPRSVKIRGSNLRLQNKEEVGTEPVDVDGRVESFSKHVRILPPRDTWVSRIQPAEVTVNVNIVTESTTREWQRVEVRGIAGSGFTGNMRFEPSFVKVVLKGRAEKVDNIASNAVMAFVDCSEIGQGVTTNLAVKLNLPIGLEVEAVVEPESVSATVSGK